MAESHAETESQRDGSLLGIGHHPVTSESAAVPSCALPCSVDSMPHFPRRLARKGSADQSASPAAPTAQYSANGRAKLPRLIFPHVIHFVSVQLQIILRLKGFFIAPSGCMALIGACGVRLTVCKRWRKPMNRWPAHQTEDVGFNSLPLPTEQCPWNGNLIRKSVPDGTCEGFSSLRRRATINHQFKVIRWGRHSVPKVSLALRNRYRWP